jgi:hypothetical protein
MPVAVSLEDYSIDTLGAIIQWYVDGEELKDRKNERSIAVLSKALGEKTDVRVVVSRPNSPQLSQSVSIVPAAVDLILEADTYVPYFYQGRALPSGDSSVKAIAVVNDGSGKKAPYSYKWAEGSTVLFGGPLKGKNAVNMTLSRYDNKTLSVEVFDSKGASVGRKAIVLRASEPELLFYEESPLRGLSERSIASPFVSFGDQVTLYGEPYYLNAQMSDADSYWSIDGQQQGASEIPNAITLEKTGSGGSALIKFTAITKGLVPQFLEDSFKIVFE